MILKNVASQLVPLGVLLTAAGAEITSSASVYVKVDSGSASAGSGTLAYTANSGWWYAPTQAETNGNALMFFLTATNAVPRSVGVLTSVGKVDVDVSSRQPTIWSSPSATVNLSGTTVKTLSDAVTLPAIPNNWITAAGIQTAAFEGAKFSAGAIVAIQSGLSTLTQSGVRAAVGLASANLDSQIAGLSTLTAAGVRTAIGMGSANLDSQLSSLSTAIGNLNNLSALCNLHGPPVLEIPDADEVEYPFSLIVRDQEGLLVDLDDPPTLTAANAAGDDRSANLSVVANPATGRYTFTYTVADDAAREAIRITASGAVTSSARYAEAIVSVVDYDLLTQIAAIRAKTDALPADPASQAAVESAVTSATSPLASQESVDAIPTAEENADAVRDELTTELGYLDAAVSTRMASESYTAPDNATLGKLDTMLEPDGETGNSKFTVPSLVGAPTGGGGDAPTAEENADAVRAELETELLAILGAESAASSAAVSAGTAATNTTTILARLGSWTGTGINTILGAFRAIFNKASGLTPSDMTSGVSGAASNTNVSLQAIRDRGDAFWTGGGGGGGSGASASEIWSHPDRTLTQTPQEAHDALKGGRITVTTHATLSVTIPGLGDLDARENLWFTAKASAVEGDDAALVQIEETAGLLRLEGAAAGTSGDGSLIVSEDESAAVTVRLEVGATSLLQLRTGGVWDLKWRNESGQVRQLRSGRFDVISAVTHAIN